MGGPLCSALIAPIVLYPTFDGIEVDYRIRGTAFWNDHTNFVVATN